MVYIGVMRLNEHACVKAWHNSQSVLASDYKLLPVFLLKSVILFRNAVKLCCMGTEIAKDKKNPPNPSSWCRSTIYSNWFYSLVQASLSPENGKHQEDLT